jgi:hypothetical protein
MTKTINDFRKLNEARTIEIPLTNGAFAIIDAEDYELVSKQKWHLKSSDGRNYAVSSIYLGPKKYKRIRMHRIIMNATTGTYVDHINGDGLDNRRENLRFSTLSQNSCNSKVHSNSGSGLKGVAYYRGRWMAQIQMLGKRKHLGSYLTKEEAARVYDKAALELHGEFARTNEMMGLI